MLLMLIATQIDLSVKFLDPQMRLISGIKDSLVTVQMHSEAQKIICQTYICREGECRFLIKYCSLDYLNARWRGGKILFCNS